MRKFSRSEWVKAAELVSRYYYEDDLEPEAIGRKVKRTIYAARRAEKRKLR
jgi:hypothetical protein